MCRVYNSHGVSCARQTLRLAVFDVTMCIRTAKWETWKRKNDERGRITERYVRRVTLQRTAWSWKVGRAAELQRPLAAGWPNGKWPPQMRRAGAWRDRRDCRRPGTGYAVYWRPALPRMDRVAGWTSIGSTTTSPGHIAPGPRTRQARRHVQHLSVQAVHTEKKTEQVNSGRYSGATNSGLTAFAHCSGVRAGQHGRRWRGPS